MHVSKVARTSPQPITPATPLPPSPPAAAASPDSSPEENGESESEHLELGNSKPSDNGPREISADEPSEGASSTGETQLHSTTPSSASRDPETRGGISSGLSGLDTERTSASGLISASGSAAPAIARPAQLPRDRPRLNWGSGTIFGSLTPAQQARARQTPERRSVEVPATRDDEFLTFSEQAQRDALRLLQFTQEQGITAEELLQQVSNHQHERGEHAGLDFNNPPNPPRRRIPDDEPTSNPDPEPSHDSSSSLSDFSSMDESSDESTITTKFIVKYSNGPSELYDLTEFETETLPENVDDDIREQLKEILKAKINRVRKYCVEVDSARTNLRMFTKFKSGDAYETWKQQFISEMSTLPFGKQLAYQEPLVNPRQPFPQSVFNSKYGMKKLVPLTSALDLELKDLISKVTKLGYNALHHSIKENPECVAIVTSIQGMNYFEHFKAIANRFAPFEDTEKLKLQNSFTNLRIGSEQSFREFYGNMMVIVHKLHRLFHVVTTNDWIFHKLSTNMPEGLRSAIYFITTTIH
jgi:hypothetical protein